MKSSKARPGKFKLVIVGCGNVAWHMAKRLASSSVFDISVVNHKPNPALDEFRFQLKVKIFIGLENAPAEADFYLLCVSDRGIAKSSSALHITNPKAVIAHVSGNTPLTILADRVQGQAVVYPLQSFSKSVDINWQETPILIEADSTASLAITSEFARHLSSTVLEVSSQSRQHFHLCAVLVNNFTNALFLAAQEHLTHTVSEDAFKLLLPLIDQSVYKIKHLSPLLAQTGPAKRKDKKTMKAHLDLIGKEKQLKKVYKEISALISEQQND